MENADAPFDLLNLIADVSLEEIERQIDYHSQQVDCLRLLRQIVEIRQEQGPPPAQELKASETIAPSKPLLAEKTVRDRKTTITENHVSKTGKMPKGRPRCWQQPVPGTYGYKILELLQTHDELASGEIAELLGVKPDAISPTLRTWTKNGLFEKVRWGVWKLADRNGLPGEIESDDPAEPATETPSDPEIFEDVPEIMAPRVETGALSATTVQPAGTLEQNRQMVANYLEFNQPAKPTTIAIDTGLDVVDVLAALECDQFERADRGWIRARQPAEIA